MSKLFDLGAMAFLVAGLLVLTRPGSQGPNLVGSIGTAFEGVIGAASGSTPKGQTPAATRTGR